MIKMKANDVHIITQQEKENELVVYISKVNTVIDLKKVNVQFMTTGSVTVNWNRAQTVDLTRSFKIPVQQNQTEKYITIRPVICNNPVLPSKHADPDLLKFDGKYYMYPTTDGFTGWSGTTFNVFSSDNLIEWEDEGTIIDLATEEHYQNMYGREVGIVPWATGKAWAPACQTKNGKYYFYFCGNEKTTKQQAIGVAVADSPVGPFVAKETPLLNAEDCVSEGINLSQVIDPAIYIEDGTSYMLFGNGTPVIVELTDDMMGFVPGTMRAIEGATGFREAIEVFKRDGLYHFTWSKDDTGSPNYSVQYGISDSLFGPIAFQYPLLEKRTELDILGTGHHSLLLDEEQDQFYIAYHRFVTPLENYTTKWAEDRDDYFGFHREICVDKVEYKQERLQKVRPTLSGLS